MNEACVNGLFLCAGLIISIGPQNTELLREGLLGTKALALATVFLICDVALVSLGALGVGSLVAVNNQVAIGLSLLTIVFLLYLSAGALRRSQAMVSISVGPCASEQRPVIKTIQRGLVLSFLNPLAVLETVVIIGSTASGYPLKERLAFMAGALCASAIWFYGVALAARRLARVLSLERHQRNIDRLAATILACTAVWLARRTFTSPH